MSIGVYKRVAERLNQLPNGFPATESGVELKLLQKIFVNTEDAENWLHLGAKPEKVEPIAERFQRPVTEVQDLIDGLASKGLIGTSKVKGTYYYFIQPFLIGLFEGNYLHGLIDEEYVKYYEEYLPELTSVYGGYQPVESRVIPINVDAGGEKVVHVFDEARQIVESGKSFKLLPCVCRYERETLGKTCPKGHSVEGEGCIVISNSEKDDGKYPIPMAKSVSREEALAHLERAAEAGLGAARLYHIKINSKAGK